MQPQQRMADLDLFIKVLQPITVSWLNLPADPRVATTFILGIVRRDFAAFGLTDVSMTKTVTIRGEEHSVMQAINRQIAHYAHHIGQILFAAKHFTAVKTGKWESLSVPRGRSKEFTADVAAGKKSQR